MTDEMGSCAVITQCVKGGTLEYKDADAPITTGGFSVLIQMFVGDLLIIVPRTWIADM